MSRISLYFIRATCYGITVGFISIPDINGNGVAELVRLREQPGPQKLFAEVRDGRTGVLLQGMYF